MLYCRPHKQELSTQVLKGNSPRMCNVNIHRDVRAVSCGVCVQCMQCARGSWLFRTQYHVPFPRVVIG